MNWRKPEERPERDKLVWIITNPHKETVASCEIHCGWVWHKRDSAHLWGIDNNDETGDGSTTWRVADHLFETINDEYPWKGSWSEKIAAWIPADEFIYPAWLADRSAQNLRRE